MLRRQDSNLDLTAPKAVVLPLHHGGPDTPNGLVSPSKSLPLKSATSAWVRRAVALEPVVIRRKYGLGMLMR